MRICLTSLLIYPVLSFSQSIPELEQQLRQAGNSLDQMTLSYQLAEAWLKQDAKKSIEFAKAAHHKSVELNDSGMAAESAYLTSRAYNRARDERNEDVWLNSAIKYAMDASDADLIIKAVDQRSRLAIKNRDERKALQVTQAAFDYFSKKGGKSISEMQAHYQVQKGQLEREKRQLEQERNQLELEIANLKRDKENLSDERDNLRQDKTELAARQVVLQQEKMLVEEEILQKQEEIKAVSAEKARALFIAERRRRLIDSLETGKALDSLALQQKAIELENARYESERGKYLVYLMGTASLFTVALSFMFYLRFLSKKKTAKQLSRQNSIIEDERQRSEELLYNIMPAEVAKELKSKGTATARRYPEATVLFTDFKNFTTIAEHLDPAELVEELNTCFRAFDHIISQYPGIEKIKTIGDAYLCASGLVDHKTIPKGIVKAALEMQEFLEDLKREKFRKDKPCFEARIGLHTGPVVAGVVGFKKFAYDIWGDTVNIAARMEEHCEPGRVNISETTFGLVKYNFRCRPRGHMAVKNKGLMEMYYVDGELS